MINEKASPHAFNLFIMHAAMAADMSGLGMKAVDQWIQTAGWRSAIKMHPRTFIEVIGVLREAAG